MADEVRPIRSKRDHAEALKAVERLWGAKAGTRHGDRLDVLVTLIEAYERKHYPMALPDPIEAIRFSMEQKGLIAKDLVPMIGQINRVYEILNGKRPLTLQMIRRLHRELGIPAESLIGEIRERRAA